MNLTITNLFQKLSVESIFLLLGLLQLLGKGVDGVHVMQAVITGIVVLLLQHRQALLQSLQLDLVGLFHLLVPAMVGANPVLKWRGLFTCDQQHRDIVTIYTDWPATCVLGVVSMIPGITGFTSDQLRLRWLLCTHDISQKQKIQIYKFKISISESEITFNLQQMRGPTFRK